MPKTTTNPFTQSIRTPVLSFSPSDSIIVGGLSSTTSILNTKLFLSASSEGSIVKSIIITSDDPANKTVGFYLNPDGGANRYLLGVVSVPLNAGNTGVTINVDVLNNSFITGLTIDQTGRQVLPLAPGSSITAGLPAALSTNRGIHITGVVEDF